MQASPARRLVVEFTKMNGAGNDFIVIDNRFYHFSREELSGLARRYCPRRTGIGADGVLALEESSEDNVHFRMLYHNADGSIGSMCGNGARCLARYARAAGLPEPTLRFETDAGLYSADVPDSEEEPVRLHLPRPGGHRTVPELADHSGFDDPHYIWTGTEHLVVFVHSARDTPLQELGPPLRRDANLGPAGANVDFVEVLAPGQLRVRTWEKGVEGETLACGTGATASAVVACLTGRVSGEAIRVHMPGGELTVGIHGPPQSPDSLYLEGAADTVFRGTVEV
jgi:diaminopimelate epimerase